MPIKDFIDHGVPHSERRERFCGHFVETGGDGARAFRLAFVVDSTANMLAVKRETDKLLADPAIRARIKEMRDSAFIACQIDARQLIQDWVDIASADPNELVSVRRTCCRFCWGVQHHYQWTRIEEWQAALPKVKPGDELPDASGGFGFDAKREPNITCPSCYGEGYASAHVTDTRNLSPRGRKLYKGAKQNRHGEIEVLMHDQEAARQNLARVMGLLGKDGQSVLGDINPPAEAPAQAATPEAARDAYMRMIKR